MDSSIRNIPVFDAASAFAEDRASPKGSDSSVVSHDSSDGSISPSQNQWDEWPAHANQAIETTYDAVPASTSMEIEFGDLVRETECASPSNCFPSPPIAMSTSFTPRAPTPLSQYNRSEPDHQQSSMDPRFLSQTQVYSQQQHSVEQSSSLMPQGTSGDLSSGPKPHDTMCDSIDSVAYPPRDTLHSSGLGLLILGLPETGTKNRVETQIKLGLALVRPASHTASECRVNDFRSEDGQVVNPHLLERIGSYPHLKLPKHAALKRHSKKHTKDAPPPNETLWLDAVVVKASDPHEEVSICNVCMERERKRSQRRRDSRVRHVEDTSEEGERDDEERKRVLIFNTGEYLDFSEGDVILPARIRCYSRHHKEKKGFCIVFTLRDWQGRKVCSATSPPICVTDDRKKTASKASQGTTDDDARSGPSKKPKIGNSKFRKNELPHRRSASNSLVMTPLTLPTPPDSSDRDSSEMPPPQLLNSLLSSLPPSQRSPNNLQSSSTISGNAHSPQTTPQQNYNSVSASVDGFPVPNAAPVQPPRPSISRLIPSEGDVSGGIEVSIIGEGFQNGLVCLFGDAVAANVQCVGENVMVCIVPPAASPGPVIVRFKGYPVTVGDGNSLPLFTYLDTSDRALLELALQVVGLQMTGVPENARNVALRIMGQQNGSGGLGLANGFTSLGDMAGPGAGTSFERTVMNVLSLPLSITTEHSLSQERQSYSLQNKNGHSLLHLSAILGLHRLVNFLLHQGVLLDLPDHCGNTALHFASIRGRSAVSRLLIGAGAARFIRNGANHTALDIAIMYDQVDVEMMLRSRKTSIQSSRTAVSLGTHSNDGDDEETDSGAYSESDVESRLSRRTSRNPSRNPSYTSLSSQFLAKSNTEPFRNGQDTSVTAPKQVDTSSKASLPLNGHGLTPSPKLNPHKDLAWLSYWLPRWSAPPPPYSEENVERHHYGKTMMAYAAMPSFVPAVDLKAWLPSLPTARRQDAEVLKQATSNQDMKAHRSTRAEGPQIVEIGNERAYSRKVGWELHNVKEAHVRAFAYHQRKYHMLKRDRMLYAFWLPILLIFIAWTIFELYSSSTLESLWQLVKL